jgi:hypothetical protein
MSVRVAVRGGRDKLRGAGGAGGPGEEEEGEGEMGGVRARLGIGGSYMRARRCDNGHKILSQQE